MSNGLEMVFQEIRRYKNTISSKPFDKLKHLESIKTRYLGIHLDIFLEYLAKTKNENTIRISRKWKISLGYAYDGIFLCCASVSIF